MWLNRLRWSAYFARHLYGQATFAFMPVDAVKRAQTLRLKKMVAYAYRSVPYYRETFDRLGLRGVNFNGIDDLARLPILEREQIQRDPEYFRSRTPLPEDLLQLTSGGSTGETRRVFHDIGGVFQNAAHGERERSIWTKMIGRTFGYRELVIASPHSSVFNVQEFCRKRALYPQGVGIAREYLSLLDPPEKVIAHINVFQPDILHTYGSYLAILFAHLAATGESFHRPTVLTYTSDALSESTRRLIEQRFHLPVFSTYQAVEAFKIGFECEQHRGIHLNMDLYPLRIIDTNTGRALPAGQSGDVIVSNLVNGGTVLLNYRLGDIATLIPDPCPCGRTLPLLSFPQGRSDDLIELSGGRIVHPQGIRGMFSDETLIWEYQVVHETDSHFLVLLFAAPDCDRAAAKKRIAAKFARLFGSRITVEIAFVSAIDRTAGGKFRAVIKRNPKTCLVSPIQSEMV